MIIGDASRRDFLLTLSALGAAAAIPGVAIAKDKAGVADRKLKILVLGGTGQTGPHFVELAIERGHTVTLFNRGNRSEELFPGVECLVGDRYPENAPGLSALEAEVEAGRKWDVCIDVWPHIPRLVEATGELLKNNVGHYMFVSSLSVYSDNSEPNQDESAAVGEAPNADEMEFSWELFGPFKAECENRVRRAFPERHTVFRPGLIVGPRDFSFRGGYWPVRVRQGGEVLAPGDGLDIIQQIDARDLVDFEMRCLERDTYGTFNVVGPKPTSPLSMKRYLETCRKASGSDATFTWADAEFLAEQQIGPWMNMPCWLPREGEYAGFGSRNIEKALAAGLTFMPLETTIKDTLEWYDSLEEESVARLHQRAGISSEREAEVLAAWHDREG